MLNIGVINKLKCTRLLEQGAYFSDFEEQEEILLPRRFVEPELNVGDEQDLFVCFDSEDRLMATPELPYATVGEFANLKVKSLTRVGAFLDWGLSKDLLLPFSEQSRDLRLGDYAVVRVYLDKSDRIAASMRLDKFLSKTASTFKEKDEVSILIVGSTPLGIKAIVDGTHWGLLYKNEVFESLLPGQKKKAFIKAIRPEGKIDLTLHAIEGHKAAEPVAELIVAKLKGAGGFLNLTEKTDPKRIYDLFGVSKKKYKIALGGLYKKKLIRILDNGIELVEKP